MGYIVLEILNVWEEQRKHATRVRWKFPEVNREALVSERVKILAEENLRLAKERKERQESVLQEEVPGPIAPLPPPAPNWADVARGRGRVEEKKAPPATQTPVSNSPIGQKQPPAAVAPAVEQLPAGRLSAKEKQPPATAALAPAVEIPVKALPNQSDSTPKAQEQTESAAPQKQSPGPQPVETPKARLPGSGLLYTDILKKDAALKQEQPKAQHQPAPAPAPAPPLLSPAPKVVKATDTDADDTEVWQKYKSKKEKKTELHESHDYQRGVTVKNRTTAPMLTPSTLLKGKRKAETAPKSTPSTTQLKAPPLPLKLGVMTQKLETKLDAEWEAKEEVTEDWAPQPQIRILIPEQPKTPTLRDLEILVDQEIEVEKQEIRRWLYRLQTWLWTFNEGVGLNFVEIMDPPDWDTGFSDAISSADGGGAEYASSGACALEGGSCLNRMGQPRRVHRGGSRNKHTLWKLKMREKEMVERELGWGLAGGEGNELEGKRVGDVGFREGAFPAAAESRGVGEWGVD